jgi:predicted  nucleic acid-binding Zn-ribbon protein
MSAKRDAYVEKLKVRLDALNAELDELEAEARKAGAEARIRYEGHLKALREKQAEAKDVLNNISDAKDDAWTDLAQGLESVWNALKSGFLDAKSEFEKGYREGMKEK